MKRPLLYAFAALVAVNLCIGVGVMAREPLAGPDAAHPAVQSAQSVDTPALPLPGQAAEPRVLIKVVVP